MITNIIILLLVALALWGVYMMAGRAVNGVPLAIIGIICILIVLAVGIWLFRGNRGVVRAQSEIYGRHCYRIQRAYMPLRGDRLCFLAVRKDQPSI